VTFTGTETYSRPLQAVPLTTRLPKVPPATSFAPAIVSSPIGPDNRILASRSHSITVRLPRYSIPISPYCLETQCCTNLQHRRYLFSGRTRYVLPFLLNHFYLSPERPSSTGTLSHQLCITQRSPECAKKKGYGHANVRTRRLCLIFLPPHSLSAQASIHAAQHRREVVYEGQGVGGEAGKRKQGEQEEGRENRCVAVLLSNSKN
jgi:hypothetical protein